MSTDIWTDAWLDSWTVLTTPAPAPAKTSWTPRVRTAGLALTYPFNFTDLILVERYGQPDTLSISGDLEDLGPAKAPGSGVVLWDDSGQQRFSGWATQIQRDGDGTGTITYVSDTQVLWDRICWPTPAAAWDGQTTAYDVQTAAAETRIIGYITRNASADAYHFGDFDRRVAHLRVPATEGRGTSGKTSARFQNLGQLVADLAEAANLRVTVVQTYEGTTPYLDVVIADVPDCSAWARFGDGSSGDLGMLGEEWSYTIGAGANAVLSAAGGDLENRQLDFAQDLSRRTAWTRHVEVFIDQRGTVDADEISQGIAAAMAENIPTVEVAAPIIGGDLEFGPGAGSIPVGAKGAVSLDGELVVNRIRQVTTTVSVTPGEPTIKIEPLFGSPDAGITLDQKALRRALRGLNKLERSQ